MLSDDQLLRYSRQIMLADIDIQGQEQLLKAKVLIVGLGGLGSPLAMYLASAGVGSLVLVDDDSVELSNLQRQIIHDNNSLGNHKVVSAKNRIHQLNDQVAVQAIAKRLDEAELDSLVNDVDVVVDCSDNFTTRFMINRSCVNHSKVLVSGAAIRMEGQLMTIDPRVAGAPCYQCLYPDVGNEELTCSESGVLAPLVGVIGSMQALEVLKVITGVGDTLVGRVLIFDAKTMQWQSLKLKADKQCPVCSEK
jgi:adenylyltransferase/sulfurtransferase